MPPGLAGFTHGLFGPHHTLHEPGHLDTQSQHSWTVCVISLVLCCCCSCAAVALRFESRWIQVSIAEDNPSIWLKGMGGSTVGVWAAHGEGQVLFPDAAVQATVVDGGLAPIRWVRTQACIPLHIV